MMVSWMPTTMIESSASSESEAPALPMDIDFLEQLRCETFGRALLLRHRTDSTSVYTWGRMGEHNLVIAPLAAGVYGTTSAVTTASPVLASVPPVRVGLLVGIGGSIARPP
ncbi:hypothetical protein NKR23_g8965 [Pleurostoma richardsiae]|uniref:Uncharacterized protein n=1 Tax=Pleurostoma richardsiae TaxID=41990 RepID=A0AA38RP95_9PEZI|nr:hypothetical protein NKR23_g8965 [Pleurostoma richardsiae]